MSNNKNSGSNLALYGIAAVGGALLGAAIYAFSGRRQETSPQSENRPKCILCGEDLTKEKTFGLQCEHKFHQLCLRANYVLHLMKGEQYKCPNCKEPVSQLILTSLVK